MTTIHFDNTDFTPAILEKCAASRLVELHNTLADKPVKRFADKPTAIKRVWKLLVEYAEQAGVETKEDEQHFTDEEMAAEGSPHTGVEPSVDLEQLGEFGLGDNDENAECPHCGINHIDNGFTTQERQREEGFPLNEKMFYACLACSGEWGPKIRRRASSDRQPTLKNCRFHVNGGKSAPNPFRAGSKSHAAFALVQGQPNISYQEFKAAGGRLRTLTHAVKIGYIRSTEGE